MKAPILLQIALPGLTLASSTLTKRVTPASETDFKELVRAAKLSSGAYASCFPTSFDVAVTLQIDNNETDTQGYVGYSDSLKRISVVMRGSTTRKDFENDRNTNMSTPVLSGVNFPADVRIMEGIYLPWKSVHDQVITEVNRLAQQNPDYEIESTGHSLGGSLTYMSYIALSQNFPNKTVTSNALAAFQIGNQAFADFGTAQKGLLRRGNNLDDGVPNVYPQMIHYGVEFYGNGTLNSTVRCEGELDTACSAGNMKVGITPEHILNSGVRMFGTGCGGNSTTSTSPTSTNGTSINGTRTNGTSTSSTGSSTNSSRSTASAAAESALANSASPMIMDIKNGATATLILGTFGFLVSFGI